MADFKKAYKEVMTHEGGYSNDSSDLGGETYKGISRRWYPGWEGWDMVDAYKPLPNFPKNLEKNTALQEAVKNFYKEEFWDDAFLGDKIPSQKIATELFDISVNMGIVIAVKFVQRSINLLNRSGTSYADIDVDGIFGKRSLRMLKISLEQGNEGYLYKLLNVLQGNRYIKIAEDNSSQEKFIRGWLKRVEITKN